MTTDTINLPAYWASALINDDFSGCDDQEEQEIREWLKNSEYGCPMYCGEESWFGQFNGIGCDLLEYTFLIKD